ncbi:hypothetical protein TCAL_09117 [Tigriopus californicus]|uniref:Apolipoprotein L3 n=1 Tax=Tigriopus californicus TaxID=6832 RepID=A0A553P5P4_TIGCA|nr:hypothetical protein TCAL_09117 [Tigriopus californicus]|eukprot:TCALIF_09117-PA protein Name:"Protein of unknown function" AED:0.02 eAED:0.02 QI:350/0.66/0.75/1/0.66/0.75/4/37/398
METDSAIRVPEYSNNNANDEAGKGENHSAGESLPSSKSAPDLPIITTVYHKSKNKRVHYMAQDWPDDMKISKEAFEEYAANIEREDFEDDIRNLSSSLHQLVSARRDTICKLRVSAEYLDSVWVRLTIAGGILTLTTAGLAAPLIIAGIATSSVGAATNIGTSLIERIINSKQVREMGTALTRDKELTLKIESQIESMRRYRGSTHLNSLMDLVEKMLGHHHILMAILRAVFSVESKHVGGSNTLSSKFLSESVHAAITGSNKEVKLSAGVVACNSTPDLSMAKSCATGAASVAATTMAKTTARGAKETIKYNPIGPDVFLETGKVVGQNSTRLAGQVIVGVSAAFLVWDAIDLGWTVTDLIRKKGSQAGKILKDKADELEEALKETTENYDVELVRD